MKSREHRGWTRQRVGLSVGSDAGKELWETEVSNLYADDRSMTDGLTWGQEINNWKSTTG
jgi:hypothetical protein